ncbi:MAG TPA: DNA polymerase, partial [Solirubrobacterales bacterium]|nr:DNA polymerase [Solirubrobacterales bacterium]
MSESVPEPAGRELFLLDGNSLAYRAFFALPETMATADGRPTNALFGFASMLVKIVADFRPAGLVVAWDAGMSGREVVYPEYKAQRPPKPDLLSEQWPHLIPMVEAFGYTNVKVPGYEADDVLATLSERAAAEGIEVVVVSGDRDVYQLVREGIRVMTTGRGVTDTKMYDREAVIERWGVPPELVTDLIGLKGDSSDNIPGVPGIGEKTAAQLLQEFGSLDGVLGSIDAISGPKRKQNLTEHAEDARVSKQLATMVRDLEIEIDLHAVMTVEPDRGALREMMRDLELRAVLERFEAALGEGESVPGEDAEEEGEELVVREATLAELPGEAAADEAVAGAPRLALAVEGERWAACEIGGSGEVLTGTAALGEVAAALAGRPVALHDAKSVGGGRHGLLAAAAEAGGEVALAHDAMLGAYLLEPSRREYDLLELAVAARLPVSAARGSADPANAAPAKSAAPQTGAAPEVDQLSLSTDGEAALDPATEAALVAALTELQLPRLEEQGLTPLLRQIELPLVTVLAAMERRGLRLDVEHLAEIGAGLEARLAELETEIHRLAGREFTIGSPRQVGEVLFEELGLSRKRRGKTGYSTDARVLAQIRDEHPIVAEIETWRELSKLKSTY